MWDVVLCLSPILVYGLLSCSTTNHNNNKESLLEQGMSATITRRRTSVVSFNNDISSTPLWKPQDSVCSITMAGTTRRRSSIDRASIEAILTSGANIQPAAPPSPHFTTSTSRTSVSSMDPPSVPSSQSTRPLSFTPRSRPNRLSLQFPVSTSTASESARPTPTSSNTPSFPATPSLANLPSPNDPSGAFLEALAAQERKVLELKEELQKAEKDLDMLKRKWAQHEVTKKRAEIRHAEPLQPLHAAAAATGGDRSEEEARALRHSIELDRRKAVANLPRESRRRVFTGHHTRALSLLSPDRTTYNGLPFPAVRESSTDGRRNETGITAMPDSSIATSRTSSKSMNRHSFQGNAANGVKQIAEDVRSGLWTFLEDLRQATVGDEAVNGNSNLRSALDGSSQHSHNRRGSKGSLLTSDRGRNAPPKSPVRTWDSLTGESPPHTESMWQDQLETRSKSPTGMKKKCKSVSLGTPSIIDDLDDDWSNWDSPTPKSPRWSGTTLEDPLTPSNHLSIKSIETPPLKKNEIPWPDLSDLKQQLTPSQLTRTVSTIMKEWEKSLTPPPEDRKDSLSQQQSKSKSQSTAAFSGIDACLM